MRGEILLSGAALAVSLATLVLVVAQERGRRRISRGAGSISRMSRWVKFGRLLETQGLCGDPKNSVRDQAIEVLGKIDEILEEHGLKRSNLLSVTVYLADIGDKETVDAEYDAWLESSREKPTRACVQAPLNERCRVEIRALASF